MTADRAALDRVADILATHADHVWGRLPFLAPMAARCDRERGAGGSRLTSLIRELRDLLFGHLDREDRVLLAIANRDPSPELVRRADRLRAEHATVAGLLDQIGTELGDGAVDAVGPTEQALRAEFRDLEQHLRDQIRLEDDLIAHAL